MVEFFAYWGIGSIAVIMLVIALGFRYDNLKQAWKRRNNEGSTIKSRFLDSLSLKQRD